MLTALADHVILGKTLGDYTMLIKLCSYCGTILMIAFSFTLYVPLAISGLVLLTIQSIKIKAHNLTILNLISLGGFIFSMM